MEKSKDIDFVVAWVDDGDLEWIKNKDYYLNKLQSTESQKNSSVDVDEIRYRDW